MRTKVFLLTIALISTVVIFSACSEKNKAEYNVISFGLPGSPYQECILSDDTSYKAGDKVWFAENPKHLGPGYWIYGKNEPLGQSDTTFIAFHKDGIWCKAFFGYIYSKKTYKTIL